MAEDSPKKDQERTISEKPGQGDSEWLRWVKKTSIAMNKRFRRTKPDFLKNLKRRK